MSKVWYCTNCGYEVKSRGRCHACGEKLVASNLPALTRLDEDDEVGYRIGDWEDWERGRLIVALNEFEILHRFEDDELVVAAEDEETVDDLVSELTSRPTDGVDLTAADGRDAGETEAQPAADDADASLVASVRSLARAARRLRADPTDMQADADVAEASAVIFFASGYPGAEEDTWAAIGRVTRRLLSVLAADEALEDAISTEAGVLAKLLEPLVGDGSKPSPGGAAEVSSRAEAGAGEPDAGPAPTVEPATTDGIFVDTGEAGAGRDEGVDESAQTVYELPEWLPEQRAQLGVLLEQAGIDYEWEHHDLVVPSEREEDVESLFARIGGPLSGEDDDDGGEARYHAIEELFAASGRLAGDPDDEERAAAVLTWVEEVDGPPPLGMDEVHWLRIMNRAHGLSQAIEEGLASDLIRDEASALHGLLRTVV
ncbi:MAG TPA: hypothetical protein VLX59_03890 [Acidimicrobiales bacterium]|nr:hypothetical protein [Acidimicrobiales bacterium]